MENKKLNIGVTDGHEFFAHEVSVNFNPLQFILDFKCITPRVDPRTKENPLLMIRHNVVMVDPWHMLQIRNLFARMIEAYEKEFGAIKKPKQIETFEKKHKKAAEKKASESKTEIPSYFG